MTQGAFQELTRNQLMTQADSPFIDSFTFILVPFIDSDRLMTQNASPFSIINS